jgi:hypothetical protein
VEILNLHETSVKCMALIYFTPKLEKGDSIAEHFLKLKDIKDQLHAIDWEIDDEVMVVITVKNLPQSNITIDRLPS